MLANSCVLQKCVIVNSLNPGKRSGLKKIPFVPLFSPLPVKFTAPPRAPGCHNSNPHLTLPSTASPIKTTAAVESFCPRGKNNNAAVATSEHHHPWHLPPRPLFHLNPLLFLSLSLIACRSQNATQLCIPSALGEPTHANV